MVINPEMNTDKCTKISPADPDLRPSFLNHLTGFVDKENARFAGTSIIFCLYKLGTIFQTLLRCFLRLYLCHQVSLCTNFITYISCPFHLTNSTSYRTG